MFAKRLRELRKEFKLTQKQLSDIIGISDRTIGYYETGDRFPNEDILKKFADYFDVSVDYLLGRTIARKPVDTLAFHSIPGYENLSDEDRQYVDDLVNRLNKKND